MYGLDDLKHDLEVAAEVSAEVSAVISKGALNIKNDWRASVGGAFTPAYPYSISYDLKGPLAAEIGPDKGARQGALGNLIEYGSVHNAPGNQGKHALDAEEPRTVIALYEVLKKRLD